jgi:hypothetical protein
MLYKIYQSCEKFCKKLQSSKFFICEFFTKVKSKDDFTMKMSNFWTILKLCVGVFSNQVVHFEVKKVTSRGERILETVFSNSEHLLTYFHSIYSDIYL